LDPLRFSKGMRLGQLPAVIEIPGYLNDAIRELTTKGLQQKPRGVEANALICFDGQKYYLGNKALGSHNASTTDHDLGDRVGVYHSHPEGSVIDVADFNQMLRPDRSIENFSLVDGAGERRSALFRTVDSPTRLTGQTLSTQGGYEKDHPPGYNARKGEHDEILDVARRASMGYYEGRGTVLYRVYPKS
jgi:hypothetical protein